MEVGSLCPLFSSLGVYVRFLARGECLNLLKITFGCCKETARSSIHTFRKLLLYSFSDAFAIDLEDENALKTSREAILNVSGLDGFSFIMDGTHFPIRQLPKDTVKACFYNRKGFKSLGAQAVINAQFKVVSFDIGYPGSTNDSTMFSSSNFKVILEEIYQKYNGQYSCMADNGYSIREYVMVPYTAYEILKYPNSEVSKLQFNAIFSSVRQAVERVFGVLQRKFYILVIGCEYTLEAYIEFIQSCVIIHNFMIDEEESYKHCIMHDSWTFDGLPTGVAEALAQLNSLREDESFITENDNIALAVGQHKRDLLRVNMPNVVQRV